jgi:hypothetical protein
LLFNNPVSSMSKCRKRSIIPVSLHRPLLPIPPKLTSELSASPPLSVISTLAAPHIHDHDSYCHQLNMAPAFWTIGCIYGATSVALGAFGAHGLKKRIADPARLQNWGTAAQYQVCINLSNLLLLKLNLSQFNHDPNSTTSRSNSLA